MKDAPNSVCDVSADRDNSIVVVVKGYPRISETFVAQELLALERRGYRLNIVSLHHPTSKKRHPVNDEIRALVNYLPQYLYREPVRVLKSWWAVRKLAGYPEAKQRWLRDLKRDFTPNRVRRFGQALVLSAEFPSDARWIYCHFIHQPASVAGYVSEILGIRWSVSAHAKDIWTSPDWELSEKLGIADWAVSCTAGGVQHLKKLSPDAGKVHLVYHGLDLNRFCTSKRNHSLADGNSPENKVELISVGRAVRKKGFDTLVDALARLPENLHWHWTHIGGGDLEDELKEQVAILGLDDKVSFLGPKTQLEVLNAYRNSDVFVLPCRIEANGDRDGLPNVIVEAQSQALMCISTHISGIPELIDNRKNGILVDPENPQVLAKAISQAITDPALRARFGNYGEKRVRRDFNHHATIKELIKLFQASGVHPSS